MTHADALALWALVIAVVGIVAHIPLSMLAHHYLPKIEDYFASYSREKLVKRIAKLQRRLDQLNDPKYFDDIEWELREHSFVIMYLFGMGFIAEAGSLFLTTGAVPKNWFWQTVNWPLGTHIPAIAIGCFLSGILLAGRAMFKSASLKPSKRSKLKSDIRAQIDALQIKLDRF
jgi:hypothetical protein